MYDPNMPGDADSSNFNAPLCNCFNDIGVCFCSCFCPCIQHGRNVAKLNQGQSGNGPCLIMCLAMVFFEPIAVLLLANFRGELRNKYDIQGGFCSDCLLSLCCTCCIITQSSEEIDIRSGRKHQHI